MREKYLVVGGGSMGKRRIRCLLANQVGLDSIRVVDLRSDRREEIKAKHGVEGFPTLETGLTWNPDAVIVSVPGSLHIEVCLAAVRVGKPVFCEVPLSIDLTGMREFLDLVKKNKVLVAPGCQPPFHPLYKQLKEWTREPDFGKPLACLEVFGQYLPDWHPYEDYRKFYASSQRMGGCNLDVIAQQATVLYWLLEDCIQEVYCRGRHLSSLEIDGHDCLQVIAQTAKGLALTQQFDLIQRAGYHSTRLITETTTLEFNPGEGNVRRYRAATKTWETVATPEGFQYEQCYIDEIALFIRSLQEKAEWHIPLAVAVEVIRFLQAMLQSAAQNKTIKIAP